jgi:uncharacterized protein YceK
MRAIVKYAGSLVAFYILIYVLLSLCGSYRTQVEISGTVTEYAVWAPVGYYDTDHHRWRRGFIPAYLFLPLWAVDINFVHKGYTQSTRPSA